MSDHEFVYSIVQAVKGGHKSSWVAAEEITGYFARQEETVKADAFEEGANSVEPCHFKSCEYVCGLDNCEYRE